MITLRSLTEAEFAARKAELEARDGTDISPELMAIWRRASKVWKIRRGVKASMEKRNERARSKKR